MSRSVSERSRYRRGRQCQFRKTLVCGEADLGFPKGTVKSQATQAVEPEFVAAQVYCIRDHLDKADLNLC